MLEIGSSETHRLYAWYSNLGNQRVDGPPVLRDHVSRGSATFKKDRSRTVLLIGGFILRDQVGHLLFDSGAVEVNGIPPHTRALSIYPCKT